MKFERKDAKHIKQAGIDMWIYPLAETEKCGALYQEVNGTHNEEIYEDKSTFTYYILEGEGVFVINGKETYVKATDVIVIEPKNKFYYKGKMKQLLVSSPKWHPEQEHIVRKL